MGYLNVVAGEARANLSIEPEVEATPGMAEANKAAILGEFKNISGIQQTVNLLAATQVVTGLSSGDRFVGVADAVFTLPAVAAANLGMTFEFECGEVSGGTGLSISPAAADHIRGNGLTSVDDKDLINTGATDRLGDAVRLYSDGVDGWVITDIVGTWAKEA